jgi:hypothetical protein
MNRRRNRALWTIAGLVAAVAIAPQFATTAVASDTWKSPSLAAADWKSPSLAAPIGKKPSLTAPIGKKPSLSFVS